MVGFDGGTETVHELNGKPVPAINPDLSSSADVTTARVLPENAGLVFLGMMKADPFDLDPATARAMLACTYQPEWQAKLGRGEAALGRSGRDR
jgi:hypothetical protein